MTQDPLGQVRTEQRGHLLLICIDRPAKRNGFTPKMFAELAAAYSLLENTHELRCGVLHRGEQSYGDSCRTENEFSFHG